MLVIEKEISSLWVVTIRGPENAVILVGRTEEEVRTKLFDYVVLYWGEIDPDGDLLEHDPNLTAEERVEEYFEKCDYESYVIEELEIDGVEDGTE